MNDLSSRVVNKRPQSTPIRKIGAMNNKSITGDKKTPIIQKRPALNARSVKEHQHNDAPIQRSLKVRGGQLNVTSTHFYDQKINVDLAQITSISFSKEFDIPDLGMGSGSGIEDLVCDFLLILLYILLIPISIFIPIFVLREIKGSVSYCL
jgi:hypothetical protein